ncbi:MAG: hypothetical protein U0798_15120 [Gemmataceae bacterium]
MSNPSITTFFQWAINLAGGGLPATQLIDSVSGRLGILQETVDSTGQNAELTGRVNRMRVVGTPIEPTFMMEPTAKEWTFLWPWLLGGTTTGAGPWVYEPGNDLPLRGIQGAEERGGTTKLHNYTNLAVDSWTLRSSPGKLIGLDIATVANGGAYEETTAFPALTNFDNVTSPFSFPDLTGEGATGQDGTFTIGDTPYDPFSISLECRYNLDRARRPHSLMAKGLRKRTRDLTLPLNLPAADAEAIYAADLRGLTGLPVVMAWRNPVESVEFLKIDLASVIFPRPDHDLPARDEVRPNVTGIIKFDGTNPPIRVVVQLRT